MSYSRTSPKSVTIRKMFPHLLATISGRGAFSDDFDTIFRFGMTKSFLLYMKVLSVRKNCETFIISCERQIMAVYKIICC
ncbi:Uncharacterized protein dnm_069120 [Desulfonema magnum]|uniref:Uncharacterized protein n=1 Tax=Desulfonema magnum TaxID=45655 RepID=A0A975BTG7_9BACT|nr:Uncharacterized protein dnm_069120 [Desulfonema magnum]